MTLKRPKVEPIREPMLFEIAKLEVAGRLANSLNVERPYSEPGLLLGTKATVTDPFAKRGMEFGYIAHCI